MAGDALRQKMGRVLIVEDNEITGQWLQRKLEDQGFESFLETSLEDCLTALEQYRFHAVVTDVYLDGDKNKEAGLEVIRQVGQRGIPLVIMTSAADFEIAKTGMNQGAYFLLEKPFTEEELVCVLQKIWEEPKGLPIIAERFFEIHGLTEKEKEISRMLLKGLSNKEIAGVCGNTEKTIKFHLTIIFDKCQVKSRTELFNAVFPT